MNPPLPARNLDLQISRQQFLISVRVACCIFLGILLDPGQDICARFRVNRQMATVCFWAGSIHLMSEEEEESKGELGSVDVGGGVRENASCESRDPRT
jgi:hypothetical protein